MIRRLLRGIFPSPWVTVFIFLMWLVLNGSATPVDIVTATFLALFLPHFTHSLRPPLIQVRHIATALRLFFLVGHDSIVSSLKVAAAMFRPNRRLPRGRFITIPLQIRSPGALAAIAAIVTVTPGTVWGELSLDRSALLLHVFDLSAADEAAYIAWIKHRYEKPLMEIFEDDAASALGH